MAKTERRVLVAGEDLSRVEAYFPLLRRLDYDVRGVVGAAEASVLVRETAFDLVMVVLPFARARDLLLLVRAPGSPCRQSALLLVRATQAAPGDDELAHMVNRELPTTASAADFEQAVSIMLGVAPRVELHGTLRMRLGGYPADQPRVGQVENLSASGMLLTTTDSMPVGSVFGFELDLPAQKEPIRGRAQVVRHARPTGDGLRGMGVSFLSLAGEGADRLQSAIRRERAAPGTHPTIGPPSSRPADLPARPSLPDRAPSTPTTPLELAMAREELAELSPTLDKLLREGLLRRLGVADWYATGVELALESLRSFSAILETVYRGHAGTRETSKRLSDLVQVRGKLEEFARPRQAVAQRVEILLEIRPALERLLRELADQGTSGDTPTGVARRRGVVPQLSADIGRLVRARRSLHNLRSQLTELGRPRYTLARRALRRKADEISHQYKSYGASLRVESPELLTRRRGQREALAAVGREIQHVEDWLATIHGKVYTPKLRKVATGDHAVDFAEERLQPVLTETLAAGYDYLARAYSAYHHALEDAGADPRLLDRVAGLTGSIEEAARLASSPLSPAGPGGPTPRPRPAAAPPPVPFGRRP